METYETVAIIPIKTHSERYERKNFRLLEGKPLYRFFLEKMDRCDFDKVFVDTDSDEIKQYTREAGYQVIDRIPELTKRDANGNDLLLYESTLVESKVYFQLFITAPFLRTDTINQAIKIMREKGSYDSLFTAYEMYTWFWYEGRPVNYDPKILPRSQDATPVVRETTGLYAIRKNALDKYKCRIGERPYMLFVDYVESIDLDNAIDFATAEGVTLLK